MTYNDAMNLSSNNLLSTDEKAAYFTARLVEQAKRMNSKDFEKIYKIISEAYSKRNDFVSIIQKVDTSISALCKFADTLMVNADAVKDFILMEDGRTYLQAYVMLASAAKRKGLNIFSRSDLKKISFL